MSRKFKALLTALLVIAVPVQGIAAMSAGICRALEHHGVATAPAAERAAPHEAHTGHSGDGASQEHDAAVADDGSPGLSSHCGDCAACGAWATITSIDYLSTPDAPRDTVRVHPPDSLAGFLLDGLDRPPLTFPV